MSSTGVQRYREPSKYKGKYLESKLGDNKFGCTIDNKLLGYINDILEDQIEKRKFPRVSDYIKYCIIKWTKIYLLKTGKNINNILSLSLFDSNIINDKILSIIAHRFELDYIDIKQMLSSHEQFNKKGGLIQFRDRFIEHINIVLSFPRTYTDLGKIRHYITNDCTIHYIADILEKEGLISKGYIDKIQFKKNEINFHIKQKNIQNDKLTNIIISRIESNKVEERLLSSAIPKIVFEENESITKEGDRKFVTLSDYTFMCIKEWTNIYRNVYNNHPLNYRYILDIDNEKSICHNYLTAIRENRLLIPSFSDLHAEINLSKWFRKNYNVFGFTNILVYDIDGSDYLCKYIDRCFRVGLEYKSGNFIVHGHDPNSVDIVICYKKDENLSIPVIPIFELSEET